VNASDPESSFWVSASAGSGKTTVLTQRLLRLLLFGVAAEKILCITFTRAAAAEIHSRINKSLTGWAICDEAELKKELAYLAGKPAGLQEIKLARRLFANVIDRPGALKIQTIHAFCQAVLGRFPLEAGLTPNFRVIDRQTAEELLEEAKRRLLLSSPKDDAELSESLKNLASRLHEERFSQLIDEVMHERIALEELLPRKNKVLEDISDFLGIKKNTEENLLAAALTNLPSEICEIIKQKKIPILLEYISTPVSQREPKDYINFFLTQKYEPRKRIAEELRPEQTRVFAVSEAMKSMQIAKDTRDFLNVAEALIVIYNHLKRVNLFLDYDDLIVKTLQLLSNRELSAWVMYKLDGGIDHILVDEAQDTSLEQWLIIENIALEFFSGQGSGKSQKTVFFVGDEKQSIFSFQGAERKMFSAMHDRFSKLAKDGGQKWFSERMDKSFRSIEAVLSAVDIVFADDERRTAITSSTLPIKHGLERTGHPGKVEVWPLVKALEKGQEARETYDPKNILARAIAEKIAEWISEGRILRGKGWKIRPGDIMVLVRKRDEFIDYLTRSLKNKNIPASGIDRMELNQQIAVMDLLAVADFLLLPEDDLNLAAVLKSPLIGFSEDDLFVLAFGRGETSLWHRLQEKKGEREIFAGAHDYLAGIIESCAGLRPFELFSGLLEKNRGREKMIARLGRQAEDPLNELLNLALQYEASHSISLQGFIHWLNKGKIEIKRDFAMARDEVKIMTVHAAKGLESPIVFLVDSTVPPDGNQRLFWMSGREREVPLYIMKSANHNSSTQNLSLAGKSGAYEEYLRLLYVAMTRAEDELYITGAGNMSKKNWYGVITGEFLNNLGKIREREFLYPEFVLNYEKKCLFIETMPGGKHIYKKEYIVENYSESLPEIFKIIS